MAISVGILDSFNAHIIGVSQKFDLTEGDLARKYLVGILKSVRFRPLFVRLPPNDLLRVLVWPLRLSMGAALYHRAARDTFLLHFWH